MSSYITSPYSGYRGPCVGRILHYLYCYCGLNVAEQAVIGLSKGEVHWPYEGRVYATITWAKHLGVEVPRFKFVDREQTDRDLVLETETNDIFREVQAQAKSYLEMLRRVDMYLENRPDKESPDEYFYRISLKRDIKEVLNT